MGKLKKELYRKQEWFDFRQSVLENDGFRCSKCGRAGTEATLQVHHLKYIDGCKPWEYPMNDCITLCKGCHAEEHGQIMPKSGWELVEMIDLEDLAGECENCGNPLRYQFEIYHPKWGSMYVGTHCCDYLTDSQLASNQIESLKKYETRKKNFIKSKRWKESGGVLTIRHGVFDVMIAPSNDKYQIMISGNVGKEYETVQQAKEKVFDVIEKGELIEWYRKHNLEIPSRKQKKRKKDTAKADGI